MKIIISHKSALEYWRLHRNENIGSVSVNHQICVPDRLPNITDLRDILPKGLSYPVNLLFGSATDRRKSKLVHPHVYKGSTSEFFFVRIAKDVLVCSPEFCFFQMAGYLSLVKLIELGFEFCGTYCLPNSGNDRLDGFGNGSETTNRKNFGHPQLTTSKALKKCISQMEGVRGLQKSSRAQRNIIEGSASPMETILTMLLCLPHKLGGYELPAPELNKKIDMKKPAALRPGQSMMHELSNAYYVCDLFWPDADIAVEYDSESYHTGAGRIARDAKKRFDLAKLGIEVITVTIGQVKDITEFESLAYYIAKKIHKRIQIKNKHFRKAQQELRDSLLKFH